MSLHPSSKVNSRWLFLFLLGFAGLTQYYVYDSMTSIEPLIRSNLNISSTSFGLLYSFYSLANVLFFALLIAGFLVDSWGYRKCGSLFLGICFLGALFTSIGASQSFPALSWKLKKWSLSSLPYELQVMLLGRLLLGIGLEGFILVTLKATSLFFSESKQAFALSTLIGCFRLGTFFALNIQPFIATYHNAQNALWVATCVSGMGCIFYFIFLKLSPTTLEIRPAGIQKERVSLKKIVHFPYAFWMTSLICLTFYGAIASFQIFNPELLNARFDYSLMASGHIASYLLIGNIVTIPLFGAYLDRLGNKGKWMQWSTCIALGGLVCILLFNSPILPVFCLGIAFSMLAAALWSSIPQHIPARYLGIGFSTMTYIQNISLTFFPWLTGWVIQRSCSQTLPLFPKALQTNYTPILLLFITLTLFSFFFATRLKQKNQISPTFEPN